MSLDFDDDEDEQNHIPVLNTEESFSPWTSFILLQRAKKYLYISTSIVLLFSLLSVILLGITVSKMRDTIQIVLACITITINLAIFGAGILQVGIYKEKDLIISM